MILVGGFDEDLHVGNSMFDMYINMTFWSVGEKCLMKYLISWMELISVYGKSGDMESARKLFDRLFDF